VRHSEKKIIGKAAFAECRVSTRQRKGTVMALALLTAALPSANPAGARQRFFFLFFLKKFFAESRMTGTRQSFYIFF
jgi:hypothetical protein